MIGEEGLLEQISRNSMFDGVNPMATPMRTQEKVKKVEGQVEEGGIITEKDEGRYKEVVAVSKEKLSA